MLNPAFPFLERWIPWYQRALFSVLVMFEQRRCVRRFLGGRWELLYFRPAHTCYWHPCLGPGEPSWAGTDFTPIKFEDWTR